MNYRHINALTVSNTYPAISILAPAKGATAEAVETYGWIFSFNPRSYERSDKGIGFFCAESKSFNPRSYERSDSEAERILYESIVSIHAPTKGATD